MIDADGDPDTAELRFTFAGDNSKATATSSAAATSDVAGDADPGSNVNAFTPQVSSGTLAIAYGSDGFGSFTASYDGALGAAVKTSAAGVTTFTGPAVYTEQTKFEKVDFSDIEKGKQLFVKHVIEIEGEAKPALVAETVVLLLP